MKSYGKAVNVFSESTFDLMADFCIEYYNDFSQITQSDRYDDFLNYVEYPFIEFCEKISKNLPLQLAFQPVNIFNSPDSSIVEKAVIEAEHGEEYEFCLQAKFSIFQLLSIQITQWGINLCISEEIYQTLIRNATEKNPDSLLKMILQDPGFLSPELYLRIDKEDILYYWGFEHSVYKVAQWFKQYLPLIILASSEQPIPVITQYLYNLKPPDLDTWTEKTGFEEAELERWLHAINRKGQAIIYGSPGTGKTFIAEKVAEKLIGNYGFYELVQFHPAYTYEDFIQGIRPQSQDGKLTYQLVPGCFLEFCKKAESYQHTCVLIIDEINRANLAQVFGELMYLLEYRDKEIPLAGGNTFRIPKNVRIIGTMNTADRSIALIDHALRRRFAFIELRPNYEVLRRYHEKTGFAVEGLINILQQLNQVISDKNYEIGISFFLTDNLREDIEDIWHMEIEPYLEEYFFNQIEKVENFRWGKINQNLWI